MSDFDIGTRVEVNGVPGTVKYCGATSFAMGKWVGIALDTPSGKNDGSVQGKRYFDCEPNFGVFIRSTQVKLLGEQVYSSVIFCCVLMGSRNRARHRVHRGVHTPASGQVRRSILQLQRPLDRLRPDALLRFPRREIRQGLLQPQPDGRHRCSLRPSRQPREQR
jgi:hypothetical protein